MWYTTQVLLLWYYSHAKLQTNGFSSVLITKSRSSYKAATVFTVLSVFTLKLLSATFEAENKSNPYQFLNWFNYKKQGNNNSIFKIRVVIFQSYLGHYFDLHQSTPLMDVHLTDTCAHLYSPTQTYNKFRTMLIHVHTNIKHTKLKILKVHVPWYHYLDISQIPQLQCTLFIVLLTVKSAKIWRYFRCQKFYVPWLRARF